MSQQQQQLRTFISGNDSKKKRGKKRSPTFSVTYLLLNRYEELVVKCWLSLVM